MAHSPIMALSVAQPWAWALIHGPKRVENRRWHTPYQGTLIIHASKSLSYLDTFEEEDWPEALPGYPGRSNLVFGAFIGSLYLVGSFEGLGMGKAIDPEFAEGPFCWVTRDPKPLPTPIEGKGRLGLFAPPQEVIDAAGLGFDFTAATARNVAYEHERAAARRGGC